MSLITLDETGKQYLLIPIDTISYETLNEINTFFKGISPFIFQASSFYQRNSEFGMLGSIPDGKLTALRLKESTLRRIAFESVQVYFFTEGNWTVSEEDFNYYISNEEIHLLLKPQYKGEKISLKEYGELFYKIITHSDTPSPESLLELVKYENFKVWLSFFEDLLSEKPFEIFMDHPLFKDFEKPFSEHQTLEIKEEEDGEINEIKISYPVHTPQHSKNWNVNVTPELFKDLTLIVEFFSQNEEELIVFFTVVDIYMRCAVHNHRPNLNCVIELVKIFYGLQESTLEVSKYIKILETIEGVIISDTNPYFRYVFVDELLIFYLEAISTPMRYFQHIDISPYIITFEPKEFVNTRKFFNRRTPLNAVSR